MPRSAAERSPAVKTLLFLTSGPYFWVHQRTVRMRYELMSEHFDGFILSYVSRPEWRRAEIGRFELNGYHISGLAYRFFLTRQLVRIGFTLFRGLALHLRRRRIDAIIAYDPFGTGALAYVLSRLIGARLVVEVNNDFQNIANWNVRSWNLVTYLKASWVSRAGAFIMNRADAVRLLYPDQIKGFHGLKPSVRVECFHACVATRLFHRGPNPDPPRRILFIGRPFYLKGVDLLIQAFNEVSAEFPDFTLCIVGHLPDKDEYRSLFERNPKIEFHGPVMPDDVAEQTAACYVLVLPSRAEAMGRVLLETMAAGRPVIASNVGGIPHYVQHGETGLLFENEDLDGLKKALRDVLGDEDFARRLGESGRRYVMGTLSDERHAEAMTQLLKSL